MSRRFGLDPFDVAWYRPELRYHVVQNRHLIIAYGHNLAAMNCDGSAGMLFLEGRFEAFESRNLLLELSGHRPLPVASPAIPETRRTRSPG